MFGNKKEDPDMEFFTVYDSKSKSYKEPFPAPNVEVLLRDFVNAFKKPDASEKNTYYINAEDYSIHKIGNFNFKSGVLESIKMEHVINMHDLRSMARPSSLSGITAT